MRFWTAIVMILILSATGLTYEIAAGRVLAPFFGTSLVTWTVVIATVLAGFSLGSALGGLVAERERRAAFASVRMALVGTAALAALSPTLLGLLYAAGARDMGGMIFSVIVAFFPASVLVTIPSPFLAKLAIEARPGREGSSLGLVLAAGSVGAIFGAVFAGFAALPLMGSAATFAGCGAVALLCALFLRETKSGGDSGLARDPKAEAGSAPLFAAAGLVVLASVAGGKACHYESGLSCIDIARNGRAVYLYSDRVQQAAERVSGDAVPTDPADRLVLDYSRWLWRRMDNDLGPTPEVLFIGGGGYTLPTLLLETRPAARAVAVEIDPLITEVVRRHLPWAGKMIEDVGYEITPGGERKPSDTDRLGIVHADGRVFLNVTDLRFDAAVMDVFSSGSVPAHLATRETYERLKTIVDGPVYVNLIDAPNGGLVRGVHAILTDLYPHVQAVQGEISSRGRANIVLTASQDPIVPLNALDDEYRTVPITPGRAFTDDRGWIGHR